MHYIYLAHVSARVNSLSIRSLSADSVNPELPSVGISRLVGKSKKICGLRDQNLLRIGYSEKRRGGNNVLSWKSLAVINGSVGKKKAVVRFVICLLDETSFKEIANSLPIVRVNPIKPKIRV